MKPIQIVLPLLAVAVLGYGQEEVEHKNELAFGLSGWPWQSRSKAPSLNVGPGVGLQVNYGRRFLEWKKFALYGEVHILASPLRQVSSNVTSATRDFASLYVTPGVRLKAFPTSRISPYFAIGVGYAQY